MNRLYSMSTQNLMMNKKVLKRTGNTKFNEGKQLHVLIEWFRLGDNDNEGAKK